MASNTTDVEHAAFNYGVRHMPACLTSTTSMMLASSNIYKERGWHGLQSINRHINMFDL
jgi:hypothetical protein